MPKQRIHFQDAEHQSRFEAHVHKWRTCRLCPLWRGRSKVVFYRGFIPCDILFIGEAPGESEDALGFPFIGPAGMLFDQLWEAARQGAGFEGTTGGPDLAVPPDNDWGQRWSTPKFGISNINACWPHDQTELETGSPRPPTKEEAAACSPRLRELVNIVQPKVVVNLGQVASRLFRKSCPNFPESGTSTLMHPSALLRMENPSSQQLSEKRWVLQLSNILKGLVAA